MVGEELEGWGWGWLKEFPQVSSSPQTVGLLSAHLRLTRVLAGHTSSCLGPAQIVLTTSKMVMAGLLGAAERSSVQCDPF